MRSVTLDTNIYVSAFQFGGKPMALLQAALNAPQKVVGFVVPVQFVDDGSSVSGTRVDHVKLFRNLPNVQFEGRIHR